MSPTAPPATPAPHSAAAALLDTCLRVETPEGIDLVLRPAGLVPRALAFAIDLGIRAALLLVLYVALGMLGELGMGLGTILLFLVTWWYMVLFEVFNQGRSPGKQLLGLRVIHDDGTPVGWAAALTRNLLRFVDLLPFGYTLGILSCLSHPACKRLGDLAAGTLVVYRDLPASTQQAPAVPAERAPFALGLDEQRAILAFAERQHSLTPARREELAGILADVLKVPAEQAEARLNGIARGLLT
ncbi:RDD family protein [Pseudomonas sp. N040]|uniref:RDD family protein n=1 Tax=Pseudomonas sp. N040 TaxID=2785325 RepID=UPI0018A33841|nr:RDD family protein [Pseudomonas sp. N040]MBF7729815.1 RDD family protein [Pseudomonas sp. N040]MBW7013457.1 RDD family protein [Pseudomonas sp. N040]